MRLYYSKKNHLKSPRLTLCQRKTYVPVERALHCCYSSPHSSHSLKYRIFVMLGPLQNSCKLLVWILKPTERRRNDWLVKTVAVHKNLHFKPFLFQD